MILRPYQSDCYDQWQIARDCGYRKILLVLPTGGGKTVLFSYIAKHHPKRVWVIAHRQELIFQASNTLTKFEVPHGIIKSGHEYDPYFRVHVASIQTLVRRLKVVEPPDLIIYDEAHHGISASSLKIYTAFPEAELLGVTATACRTNGQGLGSVFDHMILGPTTQWLTDNDFLCPAKYYAPPPKADFSGVSTRGGDYVREQLSEVMDEGEVTGDAVTHYQKICDGVPMIVFCVSVEHARHVAEEYRNAGYRAAAVDGNLSDEDRAERIGGLATGAYQVITSCDLIGEGLDVPVVTAIQLLRPTKSLGLHKQQLGRCLRPADGKTEAIVLDHVRNVETHGFATTEQKWTLESSVKQKTNGPALRTCESCFGVHVTRKTCPFCGYEYPVKSRELTAKKIVDGELVEIVQSPEERKEEITSAKSLAELTALAKAYGYKRPHYWALKVFRGRRASVNVMPKG